MGDSSDQMRKKRLQEGEVGLERLKLEPVSSGTLELGAKIDLSGLEGFAARPIEITGIADKLKPEGADGLELKANLGQIDEGIRKIREQQKNAQIQAWLDEAQTAMGRRDYVRAVGLLNQAIQADPTSGQALFLVGYCYFAMQQFSQASDALRRARSYAKNQELLVSILMLEVLCNRAEMDAFEKQLTSLMSQNRHNDALRLVEGELVRRPNDPGFLYYKCGVLFVTGQIEQVKQTANAALRLVGARHAHLFQEMLATITEVEHQKHYDEMRKAMRKLGWDQVDRLLRTHEAKLRGQRQYTMIQAYVSDKRSGNQGRGWFSSLLDRNTSGSMRPDDLQQLLFWLLSEELAEGMKALDASNFDAAHTAFSRAEKIDGRSGVMCFLHALALYRIFEQIFQQQPDLDRAMQLMSQASALLNVAVKDRVASKQSQGLKKAVDSYLAQLQQVDRQRQAREQEGQAIGALFEEFNSTMQYYSQYPISSHSELQNARQKIANLKQRVVKLRTKYSRGTEAWQALGKLEDAINNVQRQLNG